MPKFSFSVSNSSSGAAKAVGRVQAVVFVAGNFHIEVAHEAGELHGLLVRVHRQQNHGVRAAGFLPGARVNAQEQDVHLPVYQVQRVLRDAFQFDFFLWIGQKEDFAGFRIHFIEQIFAQRPHGREEQREKQCQKTLFHKKSPRRIANRVAS